MAYPSAANRKVPIKPNGIFRFDADRVASPGLRRAFSRWKTTVRGAISTKTAILAAVFPRGDAHIKHCRSRWVNPAAAAEIGAEPSLVAAWVKKYRPTS
jgi:hypothetical protein